MLDFVWNIGNQLGAVGAKVALGIVDVACHSVDELDKFCLRQARILVLLASLLADDESFRESIKLLNVVFRNHYFGFLDD